jgi:hypothetical protein
MKSFLSDHGRNALARTTQSMTPIERLYAFEEHSRLMVQIYLAGQRYRQMINQSSPNK